MKKHECYKPQAVCVHAFISEHTSAKNNILEQCVYTTNNTKIQNDTHQPQIAQNRKRGGRGRARERESQRARERERESDREREREGERGRERPRRSM